MDERGRRTKLVRTGPKVAYCLRDLVAHAAAALARSPAQAGLPGLQHQLAAEHVTLGTSVGWADIYPPDLSRSSGST